MTINSLCVFLGSSASKTPVYSDAAVELGKYLAENNIQLVYGGAGGDGLMGNLADSVLKNQGKLSGVVLESERQWWHPHLIETIMADNVAHRIEKMKELSDAFIVFPGGIGTLRELHTILDEKRSKLLGDKPLFVLNINGFFDATLQQLSAGVRDGVISQKDVDLLLVKNSVSELCEALSPARGTGLSWTRF